MITPINEYTIMIKKGKWMRDCHKSCVIKIINAQRYVAGKKIELANEVTLLLQEPGHLLQGKFGPLLALLRFHRPGSEMQYFDIRYLLE